MTPLEPDVASSFPGRRVLITGGLGFIGSNLARALVEAGATVTIVDSLMPTHGGPGRTSPGSRTSVDVTISDVRDTVGCTRTSRRRRPLQPRRADEPPRLDERPAHRPRDQLHAPSSRSSRRAGSDNPGAADRLREHAPALRAAAVPAGRRGAPDRAVDVNGINKTAGEWYHLLYGACTASRSRVLRLTNTYGPRMRVRDARQTFLGSGSGGRSRRGAPRVRRRRQRRDFTTSTTSSARSASPRRRRPPSARSSTSAVTRSQPRGARQARGATRGLGHATGSCRFPPSGRRSTSATTTRTTASSRDELGWEPAVGLARGAAATLDYFREHGESVLGGRVSVPFLDLRREHAPLRARARRGGRERARRAAGLSVGAARRGVRAARSQPSAARARRSASRRARTRSSSRCARSASAPGDEVITAANTCVPTVAGDRGGGATPVLVDVDEATFTLDPDELEDATTTRTRAIVPVHLYGQCADMDAIARHRGASTASSSSRTPRRRTAPALGGRRTGHARRGGGVQLLPDEEPRRARRRRRDRDGRRRGRGRSARAAQLRRAADGEAVRRGSNSRLDPLQAAVLSVKLRRLDGWTERRRALAALYRERLAGHVARAARGGAGSAPRLPPVRRPLADGETSSRARSSDAGSRRSSTTPARSTSTPAYRELGDPGPSRAASGSHGRS